MMVITAGDKLVQMNNHCPHKTEPFEQSSLTMDFTSKMTLFLILQNVVFMGNLSQPCPLVATLAPYSENSLVYTVPSGLWQGLYLTIMILN